MATYYTSSNIFTINIYVLCRIAIANEWRDSRW